GGRPAGPGPRNAAVRRRSGTRRRTDGSGGRQGRRPRRPPRSHRLHSWEYSVGRPEAGGCRSEHAGGNQAVSDNNRAGWDGRKTSSWVNSDNGPTTAVVAL